MPRRTIVDGKPAIVEHTVDDVQVALVKGSESVDEVLDMMGIKPIKEQIVADEMPIATLSTPAPIAEADANANPMVAIIQGVIEDVAQGIENKLGYVGAVKRQGGPYEMSLTLTAERKLREAAAAAMEIIVTHPALQGMKSPN